MPKTQTYLYNGRTLKGWTQQTLQEFLNEDETDQRAMTPYTAYALVPWMRRCIALRAGAIASIPFTLKANGVELKPDTIAAMPMTANLPALLNRVETAVCVYGAGYLLKQNNGYMTNGLQWALPSVMTPYYNLVTGELEYIIRNANNRTDNVPLDELVYFFEPAINREVGPGTALAQTALIAAGLARYADRMVSGYFERGAIGTTILTVENAGPDDPESKRLENWWKKTTAGITKAFGAIAVSKEVKPNQLVPLIKDLMVPELTANARNQIAVTMGVPQTMLEDAAQVATRVSEDRLAFYSETVIPRAEWYAQVLNEQLFKPMNMELTFQPGELEIMQEDEVVRAGSLQSLTSAGFPLDLAAEVLGYDLTDEQWKRLKEEANKPKPAPILPGQKPEDINREDAKEDEEPNPDKDEMDDDAKNEMKTWRRFALKHGAEKALSFECAHVPEPVADEIKARLKEVTSEVALKAAFDMPLKAKVEIHIDPNADYKAEAEKRLFRLFKERLNGQFEDVMRTLGDPPDWTKLTDEFWKTQAGKMLSGIRPAIQQIAQDAATEMMAGGVGVDWTLVAEEAAQWARAYVGELITNVTQVTKEAVRVAVEDFIRTPGLTMGDLQASLEHLFNPIRADMIAVTETTRAYAEGERLTAAEAKAAGINLVPYWNTNNDDLVCPVCGPRNGLPTAEMPPAHPRCRCWLTHKWEPGE